MAEAFGAAGSGWTNRAASAAVVVVGHCAYTVTVAVGKTLLADAGAIDTAFVGTANHSTIAAVVDVGGEGVTRFIARGLSVRTAYFIFTAARKHHKSERQNEGGEHFHSTEI